MALVATKYLTQSLLMDATEHVSSGNFSGALYGSNLMLDLYANSATLSSDMTYADFTIATFDGYATTSSLTWDTPYTDRDGNTTMTAANISFRATGSGVSNTIYGYVVYSNSSGYPILFAESFDTPEAISATGDGFVLVPSFSLSNDGAYGGASEVY